MDFHNTRQKLLHCFTPITDKKMYKKPVTEQLLYAREKYTGALGGFTPEMQKKSPVKLN